MSDVKIRIKVDDQNSSRVVEDLRQAVSRLGGQFTKTGQGAASAGTEIEQLRSRSMRLSRELLDLRRSGDALNATMGRQRNALQTATTAQQALIKAGLNAAQAQKRLNQEKITAITREQQYISLLEREARQLSGLGKSFGQASGGGALFARTGRELVSTFGAFAAIDAAYLIKDFATASARAAIQIDSQTRALAVLTGSAYEAERVLREIQDLADQPGLHFKQAVDGAVALRAIGTEAETTTRILRELANAAAFSGGQGEFERGLLGFRQIIQRGRISQEELNQLVENIGLASKVLKDEFGTVLAEDIQEQLDDAGQTVDDFVSRTLDGFERLERFPLDAPSVKLKNLSNSFFEFTAAVGDRFLPVIASGAEGLTRLFDTLAAGLRGTKNFTETLAELNAEIANASGEVALQKAIDGGVKSLEAFIEQSEHAIKNNSVFFGGREDAILTSQINQAKEALAGFVGVQEKSIETEQELRAELARQEAELSRIQGLQSDRNDLIAEQGRSAARASAIYLENLRQEEDVVVTSIESLEQKLHAYEEIPPAIDETTESTDAATVSTENLAVEVQNLTDIYSKLATNVQEANALFEGLGSTGADEFFRLARGEIAAYHTAIETTIPSIVNLTTEQNALNAAIDANLASIDLSVDGLESYGAQAEAIAQSLENVERRTDAHNAALVDPAVRNAALGLREYAGEVGELDVSYQSLEQITADTTAGIRRQIRAVSEITGGFQAQEVSIGNVLDELDDLEATGSEALDGFNADIVRLIQENPVEYFGALKDGIFDTDVASRDLNDSLDSMLGAFAALASGNPFPAIAEAAGIAKTALGGLIETAFAFENKAKVVSEPESRGPVIRGNTDVNALQRASAQQSIRSFLESEGSVVTGVAAQNAVDFIRQELPHILQRAGGKDFISEAFPSLLEMLFPEGATGPNTFQIESRQDAARRTAEAEGTDRQTTEDVARSQYGDVAYGTEVAAAQEASETPLTETDSGSRRRAAPPSIESARIRVDETAFDMSGATSEADFEAKRQARIDAINALYLLELGYIDTLQLSEAELANRRRSLALDYAKDLKTAEDAVNRFAETRITSEQDAADAAIAAAKQTAEEQAKATIAAEKEVAEAAERAAEDALKRAKAQQDAQESRLETGVGSARFALDTADSESDFETKRGDLIAAENALYEFRLGIINSLNLSETQLHALREKNRLAWDKALHAAEQRTNTFTVERVKAEKDAADAAVKAAADAAEALAEQKEIEAEKAEEIAEAKADAAENARKAAEEMRAVEEDLLKNAVDRAKFALQHAESETDFETKRVAFIAAINAQYEQQVANLEKLGVSEDKLRDMREDTELAWAKALSSAEDATNGFAETRIKEEERVASEVAKAAEKARAAAERTAERAAKAAERAAADKLKAAEKLAEDIQDIKDEQIENEEDRLEKIADANEKHKGELLDIEADYQDKLIDIQTEAYEKLDDINTSHADKHSDLRDTLAREMFGDVRDGEVVTFGKLTGEEQARVEDTDEYKLSKHKLDKDRRRQVRDVQEENYGMLHNPVAREHHIKAITDTVSNFIAETAQKMFGGTDGFDPNALTGAQYGAITGSDPYRQFMVGQQIQASRWLGERPADALFSTFERGSDADSAFVDTTADIQAAAQANALALTQQLTPLLEQSGIIGETAEKNVSIADKNMETAEKNVGIADKNAMTATLMETVVTKEEGAAIQLLAAGDMLQKTAEGLDLAKLTETLAGFSDSFGMQITRMGRLFENFAEDLENFNPQIGGGFPVGDQTLQATIIVETDLGNEKVRAVSDQQVGLQRHGRVFNPN